MSSWLAVKSQLLILSHVVSSIHEGSHGRMPALLFFSFLSLCFNISVFVSHFYFFEPLVFSLSALLSRFVVTFFSLVRSFLASLIFYNLFSLFLWCFLSLFTFLSRLLLFFFYICLFCLFFHSCHLPFLSNHFYFMSHSFTCSRFLRPLFLHLPLLSFHLFFPPTPSCCPP